MALNPQQERVNRALDDLLSDAERIALQTALEDDRAEADLYTRLRVVDQRLRSPAMAAPSPDFARKVMARIEAGEHEAYAPHRRTARLLTWLGVTLAAILIPAGLVVAMMAVAAGQPALFAGLLRTLLSAFHAVGSWLTGLLAFLHGVAETYPMVPALSLTIIPLAMVWAWLVWYLPQRNRPETIVIKVQAVGSGL